jgi:NagD protein
MAVVPHAAVPLSSPDSATEVSSAMSSDPSTAEMVLPAKERAAIHSWLMDMDGVLVHEQHMIAGADRFLSLLRERKLPFLVLTNNSLFTRHDLSARLKRSGLDVPENAIWTSALATARFLGDQRPGGSAFVIGEAGLTTALHASGYTLTEQDPDYVVIGETRTYSFSRITQAIRHIVAGARFIATNPDPSGPSTEGPLPATGSLAALISRASGVSPYYVGKPNPLMMRTALNTIDGHSESTAMIGDSMKTDIVSGLEAGLETILVLTGVTSPDDVDRFTYRPSRIVNSIADLIPELEARGADAKANTRGSGRRRRPQQGSATP